MVNTDFYIKSCRGTENVPRFFYLLAENVLAIWKKVIYNIIG